MSDSFLVQNGQRFVFAGDSITDCGRMAQSYPFGDGYVRQTIDLIRARYPERDIAFWNEGIGGNTVEDLRNRWMDDVIRHQPDWVSIKIGINDLHRTLGDPGSLPPARYEELYRSILKDTARQTKARLILIDPFYMSTDTGSSGFRSKVLAALPGYIEVARRLAEEFGALHIRTHEEFQKQLSFRPGDTFCSEPVHECLRPPGHHPCLAACPELVGWKAEGCRGVGCRYKRRYGVFLFEVERRYPGRLLSRGRSCQRPYPHPSIRPHPYSLQPSVPPHAALFRLRGRELVRELAHVRLLLCMFDGHTHEAAVVVQLNEDIVIHVARFSDQSVAEVDQKRVGIGEVSHLHGLPPDKRGERSEE